MGMYPLAASKDEIAYFSLKSRQNKIAANSIPIRNQNAIVRSGRVIAALCPHIAPSNGDEPQQPAIKTSSPSAGPPTKANRKITMPRFKPANISGNKKAADKAALFFVTGCLQPLARIVFQLEW